MSLVYRPDHPQSNENGFIDKSLLLDNIHRGAAAYVITDEMSATRNMCDGKFYTSKAKFRATTKAYGCIEVGNETTTLLKPRKPIELSRSERRDDIRRAIHELRNGR